jgi:AGCS family alanine or glycine:cation symporter
MEGHNLVGLLEKIDGLVWGVPLLVLLVGTGIYLSLSLGFLQVTKLPLALKLLFKREEKDSKVEGDISSFAALCTALSATIGTGNIVGVATAIQLGGPGAMFWMWLAAFFGMATKYAECLLAVKFREVDSNGNMSGGPMYYLQNGLNNKFLAKAFALFGIGVAFFGIGTFPQVNAITSGLEGGFNVPVIASGTILTILVAMVTLGGIKSISKVAQIVVPFMAIFYVLGALTVLGLDLTGTVEAFKLVITSAFTGHAAAGGFAGATVMIAIKSGVSRGVFSNESGLGSAPIAAAAAKTNSPVKQGLIAMTGTFLDTIIVCSMTGLVLIKSGLWSSEGLEGAILTNAAFSSGLGIESLSTLIVNVGIMFFAFTTILGWNYYGERCSMYLFGAKSIKIYKLIFIVLVAIGPFLKLETIWIIADIVNGLMAVPNLIGIIALREVIKSETFQYFKAKLVVAE